MDIFAPIRFRTSVQLAPSDLLANFQETILDKVRVSLEGVCSRYGYIRPGSIVIVKRSTGSFIKQHFNGHIKFDMICKAEVCNPAIGAVFKAIVKNKNALGVHAESVTHEDDVTHPVLDIIVPKRSAGITSTIDLEDVNVGDIVYVEVLGKRYQLHDKKISIIGRAIKEPTLPGSLLDDEDVEDDDDALSSAIETQNVDIDISDDDESANDSVVQEGGEDDSDEDDDYTQKVGQEDEDADQDEVSLSEEFDDIDSIASGDNDEFENNDDEY
jgi:hypothetical protein